MTQAFETVQVPMVRLSDGRQAITALAVQEQPWIMEFIGRFSNYWTYDCAIEAWVSPPVSSGG